MTAHTEHRQPQPPMPDGLARRAVAALTEPMVVVENDHAAWGDHEVAVYSGETSKYIVNVAVGHCECADHQYRQHQCKHIRRARYALGLDDVPEWARAEAIDPTLRLRLDQEDSR